MAPGKFTEDDLADYDEEFYDDNEEDDREEYNFVDSSTKKTVKKNTPVQPVPVVKTSRLPGTSGVTSNQLCRMKNLMADLQLQYPLSYYFLEKCLKSQEPILQVAKRGLDILGLPFSKHPLEHHQKLRLLCLKML
jgi:hypothetical protein